MTINEIHETKTHGKLSFPYIVYRGNLPEYIRSYPLHWHDEMEIITISSGRGIITVQSKQYEVTEGDLILIQPQIVHAIDQINDTSMEYFNILFRFSLLDNNLNDGCYDKYLKPLYERTKKVPVYIPHREPLNRLLQPYIDDLTKNRRECYISHELMVMSDLFAIIHHLQAFCEDTNKADRSLQTTYNKLKTVLIYVQKNYAAPITVDQAANICGFSASHFMKLFRELMGTSFTQYLKDYRLEIAAELLLHTTFKVTEIAESTGFENLSYFTRSFASKYGVTPSAYRKKN